jgi:hypothetical protein
MDIRDASDQQLVAELESRGFFSRLISKLIPQSDFPTVPPPVQGPLLGKFLPGTDREVPKNATSVVEVPDRRNKDGSQLRMITVAGPSADKDLKPRFIVKGNERERLAQNFIDQWKDEIAALERRLEEEKLPQDEITSIWNEINRLQTQIAKRADSAFGSMGIEEVRARNIALNGAASVMDAKSEPGVVGRGVRVVVVTGFPAFDSPGRLLFLVSDLAGTRAREIETTLNWDPYVLHLPHPAMKVHEDNRVTVLGEPVVLWRILHIAEEWARKDHTRLKDNAFLVALGTAWNDVQPLAHPIINLDSNSPAVSFQSNWTSMLMSRLRAMPSEEQRQGIKRTIRILNVDFQEQEAPDFMFETGTDGANPLGAEHRPHVNPRAAWSEVEESPGVFKMKRREPLDRNDPDEEAP